MIFHAHINPAQPLFLPLSLIAKTSSRSTIMKLALIAPVCLGLLTLTWADEAAFRNLERQSIDFQLGNFTTSENGCTSENIAVRREW